MNHLVLPTEKRYKKLKVSSLIFLRKAGPVRMYGGMLDTGEHLFVYLSPIAVVIGYNEIEYKALYENDTVIRFNKIGEALIQIEEVAEILQWQIPECIY